MKGHFGSQIMCCPLSVNGLPRMTIGERGKGSEVGERLIQSFLNIITITNTRFLRLTQHKVKMAIHKPKLIKRKNILINE